MKHIVAGHVAADTTDFIELAIGTPVDLWLGDETPLEQIEIALGTPVDLWLGIENESPWEREARLDAARDILADTPHLADDTLRLAARIIEDHAPDLFNVVALPQRPTRPARLGRGGRGVRKGTAA
ncbi:hypothetical protein [Streptomyces sp. NPDC059816]|uniref:hypothetical protein n=1 Tax=Streptomyces sp. NPDC059816 TaxID=3346960 RepID=UPI0036612B79